MRHVCNQLPPIFHCLPPVPLLFYVASIKVIPKRFVRLLGQSIRMAHDNSHRFFIVGCWFVGNALLDSELMLGFLVETGRVRILANVLTVDGMLLDMKLCRRHCGNK